MNHFPKFNNGRLITDNGFSAVISGHLPNRITFHMVKSGKKDRIATDEGADRH